MKDGLTPIVCRMCLHQCPSANTKPLAAGALPVVPCPSAVGCKVGPTRSSRDNRHRIDLSFYYAWYKSTCLSIVRGTDRPVFLSFLVQSGASNTKPSAAGCKVGPTCSSRDNRNINSPFQPTCAPGATAATSSGRVFLRNTISYRELEPFLQELG